LQDTLIIDYFQRKNLFLFAKAFRGIDKELIALDFLNSFLEIILEEPKNVSY
jgi:hypothetical protein